MKASAPSAISFEIHERSRVCHARRGTVRTPHGSFETPAFMPVGTKAAVKGLLPDLVRETGSEIILNNTYHLMLRPGSKLIGRLGGVHRFMRWDGPILTDSGGYQVFSMSDINKIDEDGVTFRSIVNGSKIHLTPEEATRIQNDLGADIIMAFDDCPPAGSPADDPAAHARRLDRANDRTARWLERCVAAHERPDEQALFGIVQGGVDLDRRTQSVEQICGIDLPGYAIGGVAVGEGPDEIQTVVEHTAPRLPADKPRYLMGVGYEWDIVTAVRAGVDMFDCVLPTRNGRNATAFTKRGRVKMRNAAHAADDHPIESGCDCTACRGGYSRAYLRHLFMAGEMLGPILVSLHNIAHFQRLMRDIRRAIGNDDWWGLAHAWPVLRARGSAPEKEEQESDAPAASEGSQPRK